MHEMWGTRSCYCVTGQHSTGEDITPCVWVAFTLLRVDGTESPVSRILELGRTTLELSTSIDLPLLQLAELQTAILGKL